MVIPQNDVSQQQEMYLTYDYPIGPEEIVSSSSRIGTQDQSLQPPIPDDIKSSVLSNKKQKVHNMKPMDEEDLDDL